MATSSTPSELDYRPSYLAAAIVSAVIFVLYLVTLAPSTAVQPAVQDAWDILTSQLRDGGFTFLGLGVILLVALWLAGPSPSGVSTRRWLAPYLARPEIAYGVAGGLFLALLWWSPTVQTTRVPLMLAAALVLALGVELLRRQTAREVPAPPPE